MFDMTSTHSPARPPSFRPISDIIPAGLVMPQAGIYQIRFIGGPAQNFGEGIAVLKDGKINGADTGYVYQGSYESENEHVKAMIKAKRWRIVPNALINLSEYDLIVENQKQTDNKGFLIQTRIQQQPSVSIRIEGTRLADAV